MKINKHQGELTDISGKKEALHTNSCTLVNVNQAGIVYSLLNYVSNLHYVCCQHYKRSDKTLLGTVTQVKCFEYLPFVEPSLLLATKLQTRRD